MSFLLNLVPAPYRILAELALVAAIALAVGLALHHYGNTRYEAGKAEVQAKWDKKEKADADARAADAREQSRFNDKAAGNHAAELASLQDQLGAAREQIAQLSGRACLSASTVSMLNSTGVLDGSAAPGEPASAPQAASSGADDGAVATDKDLAGYIALCRTRYAEVADQLNKILDIEDQRHPPGH